MIGGARSNPDVEIELETGDDFGAAQGWTKKQTDNGPPTWVDENGVKRLTIKRGSSRTPGSELPHVEMRNAAGQRIDAYGNRTPQRDLRNHTPIEWDW